MKPNLHVYIGIPGSGKSTGAMNFISTRKEFPRAGQRIECPRCGEEFTLEES